VHNGAAAHSTGYDGMVKVNIMLITPRMMPKDKVPIVQLY